MTDYDNTNRGVLFKNDSKKTDRHPDYSGHIELEGGQVHYLDAWINESKKGRKYLAVRIGNAKEQAEPKPAEQPDFDDDIPF